MGTSLGLAILPLYLFTTLLVGWWSRRSRDSANSFLNASHSLPLSVVTAAYLASNCGALEVVGMSAMAAAYGVQALHFYLIGAIPAMIFLSLWMLPVYARSGVKSVPGYLEQRFGKGMRLMNACVSACTMLLLGGISLYAMAQMLDVIAGLKFGTSVLLSSGVVLIYVLLGGVRATIYNEVLQLAVMLAGLSPLTFILWRRQAFQHLEHVDSRFHLWRGQPFLDHHAQGDVFGWFIGLGFVLSCGYWCTDFVQMQRAFTAKSETEARQVPLIAGFGKLLFAMIVVLPGVVAPKLIPGIGSTVRADRALPALMKVLYGPTMLGLGVTAVAASLMSGLASNVSGFAAIWTEEIYRPCFKADASESHYLRVGRVALVACIVISAGTSYLNFFFSNLMEHVQLIFSLTAAPFWGVFLLAMTVRRANGSGAMTGFIGGCFAAVLYLLASTRGWLVYGSRMSANFHMAVVSFTVAFAVGYFASLRFQQPGAISRSDLVFSWKLTNEEVRPQLWMLAGGLFILFVALNAWWW